MVPTELGDKRPPPDGEWEHGCLPGAGTLKDYSLTLRENTKYRKNLFMSSGNKEACWPLS